MKINLVSEIREFVRQHIPEFHQRRLERLLELALTDVLKRKNPYLFRAKNILVASELVRSILDAHLSSQEETLFGTTLEQLAIHVCSLQFGGKKSAVEGIDLEFDRSGIRYLVTIKSGPNWGNSGQIAKMRDHFKKARKILRTNARATPLVFVNGCCYGKGDRDHGDYRKMCGEAFWELVSGEPTLFVDIIEPLGHDAPVRNEEFRIEYAKVLNTFTEDFSIEFCDISGSINWDKLVRFNSATVGARVRK